MTKRGSPAYSPVMKVAPSELAMATGVAVASVGLIYAMMLSERSTLHHALQLAAPSEVRPGAPLPMRSYLMHGVEADEMPTLIEGDVEVSVLDGERTLSSTVLSRSPTLTGEGALEAPSAPGSYALRAVATGDDGAVLATVTTPLTVSSEAARAAELGRLAAPLSQFALGPITIESGELPPRAFEVRIASGICVPDRPCGLLIDVGADDLEIAIEPGPAIRVLGVPAREGRYIQQWVQVTGSEGEFLLGVTRQGRMVARRSVRLPIALATPYLALGTPFVREGRAPLIVAAPPGRTALVIDIAEDGHFLRTLTLPPAELDEAGLGLLDLALADLPDGIYRLQLRADPFPTDHTVGRLVRVGQPSVEEPLLASDGPITFAFAAADAEASELELPRTVSGLAGDVARIEASRSIVRVVTFAGMLVAGVLLVMAILRRGMAADADAAALMREAGAAYDPEASRHQRRTLALAILALALAVLTGIALVAARAVLE
jgi:hypothetical protein